MNYVDLLSFNIFMNVIYRYVLVFVDRFIKMKHLILIVLMKIKEFINFSTHTFENIMTCQNSSCLTKTHNSSLMFENIYAKC